MNNSNSNSNSKSYFIAPYSPKGGIGLVAIKVMISTGITN